MPSEPSRLRPGTGLPGAAALLAAAWLAACSEAEKPGPPRPRTIPTAHAPAVRPSLMGTDSVYGLAALADTLKARALRGDTLGLIRLMADDSAYRRHVYPLSPVYDSTRSEVFRFVLTLHKANNAKGLARLLRTHKRDTVAPAFGPLAVDSLPIPGGMIYRTRPSDPSRLFSEAVRVGDAVRVVSYAGARVRTNAEGLDSEKGSSAEPAEIPAKPL